ncbi:helix-turn-helix domain-containing protein [Hoeflea sp. TYP-13]|uniref:helix-turn-helix domain-containing protein n=1 Tax=Hoeflea sp. TYP-13 TaxID=3230023 RepID=UPI0034C640B6
MNVAPTPDIGKLVKSTRKALDLTLEQLAERSGVSRSMLSAIERGTANPTFSIVWALAQSLGLDLATLEGTSRQDEPIEHVHHYSIPMRRSADGRCELFMLSPVRTVLPVEWHHLVMKPEGCLESKAHAAGTFEHLTCLSGALSVSVDGKSVHAQAGDTLRYRADKPHRIDNTAGEETRALLLVAQPDQYRTKTTTV